jgi:type IV pilus assembly protein PilA
MMSASLARPQEFRMSSHAAPARRQLAFTVLELVVVIALTGIVGALAYSAHRTYTIRGEVADGIRDAKKLTTSIGTAFRRYGEAPATTAEAEGSSAIGKSGSIFVASIVVEDGRIDVLYGNRASTAIAGRRLSLTPYETASLDVVWVCGNEVPGPGLQPLGFAGGGRQAVQIATTIETRYLPSTCR